MWPTHTNELGSDECQLYALRWALEAAPKDATVNRRAAETLARLGQFDQAISCWRRVEQAKPGDQEAAKAISQLSVEKTIHQGGYNQELLQGAVRGSERDGIGAPRAHGSGTAHSGGCCREKPKPDSGRERALLDAVANQPAEIGNYVELAELFTAQNRLREAEEILTRALAASGGGDLAVRERLEEAHLRRAHSQVTVAQRRAEQEKTPEAADLARRMAAQANQAELEVYAARAARNPGNLLLQYEFGMRCKRAGKFKRGDPGVSGGPRRHSAQGAGSAAFGRIVSAHPAVQAGAVELRGGGRSGGFDPARHEKTGTLPGRRAGRRAGRPRQGGKASHAACGHRFRLPRRGGPAGQTGRNPR